MEYPVIHLLWKASCHFVYWLIKCGQPVVYWTLFESTDTWVANILAINTCILFTNIDHSHAPKNMTLWPNSDMGILANHNTSCIHWLAAKNCLFSYVLYEVLLGKYTIYMIKIVQKGKLSTKEIFRCGNRLNWRRYGCPWLQK